MSKKPTIAVSAVQGAFIEHEKRLASLGCEVFELRQATDLERPFDALVLPGGESTVQAKLLRELNMFGTMRARIVEGMPVLGTCAGLILLAERIEDGDGDLAGLDPEIAAVRTRVTGFGTLPVTVRRNGYGRQLGSFHAHAPFTAEGAAPRRAHDEAATQLPCHLERPNFAEPREATAAFAIGMEPNAKAAPTVPMTFIRAPFITEVRADAGAKALAEVDGRIVAAQAGNQIGVAFHPELDEDNTVYQAFLALI
ncbi:MAG: pyridoxal 5'-phosphate synthase glutaminase subunit PdxT [Eggerthellaceae bacterium]|nr:pyridoxal 5'-phosphate synthase glutaminase subunit PdxT [Eggerthellaceae bacterium]